MVNRNATSPWPFVAACGMAMAFFCYAFIPFAYEGVGIPWWGIALLLAIWGVLFVVLTRWWTPRPTLTVVLPVVAFVLLFLVAYAGGRWWGWQA